MSKKFRVTCFHGGIAKSAQLKDTREEAEQIGQNWTLGRSHNNYYQVEEVEPSLGQSYTPPPTLDTILTQTR